MRKEDVKKGSIYELDGVVPLKEALPLGIQHVLAMFLGNISPLLIIAGMLGLSPDLKSALIQNAMFIAGAVTLVQLYPVWKVGAKLPIVMGTSSGFIGTAKAMGALYGYGALMGASLIGGLFEMVLGFFIKPLRKLFPPVVTSLVIISIGLSLLPVGINYFGVGQNIARSSQQAENILRDIFKELFCQIHTLFPFSLFLYTSGNCSISAAASQPQNPPITV